tara:strand:- start:359 stop:736 length:378 start_codon:yes stop_codon:yes gene_type:complete
MTLYFGDGTNQATAASSVNSGGVVKAWARYGCDDTTLDDSYNISSVSSTASGAFTLNFSTSFANTNYAVACSASREGTTSDAVPMTAGTRNGSFATGSCRINTGWPDNGHMYNTEAIGVIICGDQ